MDLESVARLLATSATGMMPDTLVCVTPQMDVNTPYGPGKVYVEAHYAPLWKYWLTTAAEAAEEIERQRSLT